jgi:uncharacterized protein (TIGR03032 family)
MEATAVNGDESSVGVGAGVASQPPTPATVSRGFVAWMIRHRVALACSCAESGDLFFVGSAPNGAPVFSRSRFSRAMGLAGFSQRLFLADRAQIWRLENALAPGKIANGRFDRVYAPRSALVTGDIDTHEIGVDGAGRVVFVNTAYSCLALPSVTHAFRPIWKPKFVSKLVPEDRCHLNGIGMASGRPKVVSVCSLTDFVDGWRNHRADGGAIIDVDTDKVLAEGLSMPHSPRLHEGALWAVNSGSGHLLRFDPQTGKREAVVFAPGFLRGLAFCGMYAVITMSLPKTGRLEGLPLGDNIRRSGATPWCGLLVVDLRQGAIAEWLHFGDLIHQLFDVAVLPQMRSPTGVAPDSAELQETITIEEATGA